jgi:hypothetical protein
MYLTLVHAVGELNDLLPNAHVIDNMDAIRNSRVVLKQIFIVDFVFLSY